MTFVNFTSCMIKQLGCHGFPQSWNESMIAVLKSNLGFPGSLADVALNEKDRVRRYVAQKSIEFVLIQQSIPSRQTKHLQIACFLVMKSNQIGGDGAVKLAAHSFIDDLIAGFGGRKQKRKNNSASGSTTEEL